MTEIIKTKPGDVFGRLTIRRIYRDFDKRGSFMVVDAVCACGGFAWKKRLKDIKAGKVASDGCLRIEKSQERLNNWRKTKS